MTALADGLVERGLVTRKGATDDRRQVMHGLTPEGRKVLSAADAAIEQRLDTLSEELSDPDRARAFKGLDAWGRALDAYRAKVVKTV